MIKITKISNPTLKNNFHIEPPIYLVSGIVNWRLTTKPNVWYPPTDVYETDKNIIVRVEVAGMNENDFSIGIHQNILVISGVRRESSTSRSFHQIEIHFGEFYADIEIPIPIERENIEASYQDGFLLVILPKLRTKQINIT